MENAIPTKVLPNYEEALAIVLAGAPMLASQPVDLAEALGRVLREPVVADRDQPPFHRAAMDGFAVHFADIQSGASLPVVGAVAAGAFTESQTPLAPGTAVHIATGAAVPPGADAVIQIEKATLDKSTDPPRVSFEWDQCPQWKNIHTRATDATAGQPVIEPGTRLGPAQVGIAASVGATQLAVAEQPRITLLTTGDELRTTATPTDELQPQQIRNSNGPMLTAFFQSLGTPLRQHVHVPDEPEQTLAAAREALSHSHLVVTVGGISVGQRDFLPAVWEQLGLRKLVHGVSIQPGKPVMVVTPSTDEVQDNKLVIGLPGNPASALTCAHLFVRPLVETMLAGSDVATKRRGSEGVLPWRMVKLAAATRANPRRQLFRAARLLPSGEAEVIEWHGSGDLVHTVNAEGLVRLPVQDEPVAAGSAVPYLSLVAGP